MTNMLEAYYTVGRKIGKGSYGCIYSGIRNRDSVPVAIKFVETDEMGPEDQNDTIHEVMVMSQIEHRYIVRFYDSFMQDNNVITCMEYVKGGDLADVISRAKKDKVYVDEDVIWKYAAQMCLALKYLHDRRIVHRDLKPRNVMLDEKGNIKIADFGFGKLLGATKGFASIVGTPLYQAPELVVGKGGNEKVDVWAFGCIIYEVATLKLPFDAGTQEELSRKILHTTPAPLPSYYSKELNDFIFSTFVIDMDKRPSINTLLRFPKIRQTLLEMGDLNPLDDEESFVWQEMTKQLGDNKSTAAQLSWLVHELAKVHADAEATEAAKKEKADAKPEEILGLSRRSSSKIRDLMREIEEERDRLRAKEAELAEVAQSLERERLNLSARRREFEEARSRFVADLPSSPRKGLSSPGVAGIYGSPSVIVSSGEHTAAPIMPKKKLDLDGNDDEDDGDDVFSGKGPLFGGDSVGEDKGARPGAPAGSTKPVPAVPMSPMKQAHHKKEQLPAVSTTVKIPRQGSGKSNRIQTHKSASYILVKSEYLGLTDFIPAGVCVSAVYAWMKEKTETRALKASGKLDGRYAMSPTWVPHDSRLFTKPQTHIIIMYRINTDMASSIPSRSFDLRFMHVGYVGGTGFSKEQIQPGQILPVPCTSRSDGTHWFYVKFKSVNDIREAVLEFDSPSLVEEVLILRGNALAEILGKAESEKASVSLQS